MHTKHTLHPGSHKPKTVSAEQCTTTPSQGHKEKHVDIGNKHVPLITRVQKKRPTTLTYESYSGRNHIT